MTPLEETKQQQKQFLTEVSEIANKYSSLGEYMLITTPRHAAISVTPYGTDETDFIAISIRKRSTEKGRYLAPCAAKLTATVIATIIDNLKDQQ